MIDLSDNRYEFGELGLQSQFATYDHAPAIVDESEMLDIVGIAGEGLVLVHANRSPNEPADQFVIGRTTPNTFNGMHHGHIQANPDTRHQPDSYRKQVDIFIARVLPEAIDAPQAVFVDPGESNFTRIGRFVSTHKVFYDLAPETAFDHFWVSHGPNKSSPFGLLCVFSGERPPGRFEEDRTKGVLLASGDRGAQPAEEVAAQRALARSE